MSEKIGGRWIPLESNPDVFNLWTEKAGVAKKSAHFVDVYGLDEDLLSFVPRPVKAVILLFPIDEAGDVERKKEDERIAKQGQPKLDDTVLWLKQHISNACGTIGLIHALANSNITLGPTSPLQKFIIECQDKTPEERAQLLGTTPLFANIHAETANVGQTAPQAKTDLHFTCFVEAPEEDFRKVARGENVSEASKAEKSSGMRLIELDGRRAGPIDRGECKDLLFAAANFVRTRYLAASSSVYFSLMALTTAPPQE
jgi:ubiquitin carboxyl-terminal hydrolase L3